MSRVNSSSSRAAPEVAAAAPAALAAPAAIPTEPLAAPMSTSETSLFDSAEVSSRASLSEVHTRNVVVDARLTATELNLGKSVPLSRNLAPPCLGRCPSPQVLICKLVLKISRTPRIARIRRLQQSQLTRRHVS